MFFLLNHLAWFGLDRILFCLAKSALKRWCMEGQGMAWLTLSLTYIFKYRVDYECMVSPYCHIFDYKDTFWRPIIPLAIILTAIPANDTVDSHYILFWHQHKWDQEWSIYRFLIFRLTWKCSRPQNTNPLIFVKSRHLHVVQKRS